MVRLRSMTVGLSVIALLAAGVVTFAQGPRRGPGERGFGPRGLGNIPLRQLNLTDAQRTQLQQIREQHRADLEAAMRKLAAARQAQRAAIESVPVDEAKITSLTQDLTPAEVEVAIQTARLNADVWNVLTDAQKAQVTKLRADRQARAAERQKRGAERRQRR